MKHEIRFTAEKIAHYLKIVDELVYRDSEPIAPFRYRKLAGPLEEPSVAPGIDDSGWDVIEPYDHWGVRGTDFILRTTFSVPAGHSESLQAALYLPIGDAGDFSHPETLVYIDGEPYASCDRHHREILLPERWCDGESHVLALHGWTGIGEDVPVPPVRTKIMMCPCSVVWIDRPTRDFAAAARVALGSAKSMETNDPVRFKLLNTLDDAFVALDLREPFGDRFYESVPPALEIFRGGIELAGAPLDVDIAATGHSHIDVAWLWTLGQTRKKIGRTFHTVLRLMEQFPGYHFTQSQAQLYDFMRRDYPALFEEVKERVREDRWEVIGGMWVESDCNVTGPESLARQFLLGRTFFREHFGSDAESPVLWLPDVFGYAWSLPQLIKQAGLDYFFTIKISWNQYNRLPYDTFWWQGLDGTRVLTHFSTSPELEVEQQFTQMSTYNSKATPEQVMDTWRNFQQKELGQELLMAYGYGDGGGGPTREMLENIGELESFPGMPRMKQKSAGDFFRDLEARHGSELPVWNGELYLELHRGTYTSQGRTKRANRKCEFLLHDAEFLAAFASTVDQTFRYPAEDIGKAWELVCLNQFHDIIPGSSIGPVYTESLNQYETAASTCRAIRNDALSVIADHIAGDVIIVNPTSFAVRGLAFHEGKGLYCDVIERDDGAKAVIQTTGGGCWIDPGELPPYSITPYFVRDTKAESVSGLVVESRLLENDYVRVELNDNGDISRIFDKTANREVLPEGAVANRFQAFDDRPLEWDAWDTFIYYDDKTYLSEPASDNRVIESGPLRGTIEIQRRILGSDYVQRISLTHNSKRIDIETDIDWRERHILLKAAFPVEVFSPSATFEVQWGNVQRPTHRNTSWDWARFETCAQKWVDLSEGDYGVSLLNDCKYGHDIRDNVIRITLLRSPTNPDPEADQGSHRFTYSLLPHEGAWDETTIREAYALNDPLIVTLGNVVGPPAEGDRKPDVASLSLVGVDNPNIVIETVKAAEDSNGIIVRMYECMRRRGVATLTASFDIDRAWVTNLLEEDTTELETDGPRVSFTFTPYRIITLRLVPADTAGET